MRFLQRDISHASPLLLCTMVFQETLATAGQSETMLFTEKKKKYDSPWSSLVFHSSLEQLPLALVAPAFFSTAKAMEFTEISRPIENKVC